MHKVFPPRKGMAGVLSEEVSCSVSRAGTVAMASAPFVLISHRANSSHSSHQTQAGSANPDGGVCWWHTGEKPSDAVAEVGMW